MQGDVLFPVLSLFNCEDNKSLPFPTFLFVVFCVFFSFFGLCNDVSKISPNLSALTGLAVHTMPSAFGSHLFSDLVKFFGFDPGAAGLPCVSPLGLGLCLDKSLSVFGRATFIGWSPLEPPGWSLGVLRRHSGALLVFLFLVFDLLNDLPDLPLCSLFEWQHKEE